MTELPEPAADTADPAVLFANYLTFYRERAIEKVTSLAVEEQRTSRLSSGWTPLELLFHLAHMEQRWLVWGFLGEDVAEPWGEDLDGRWHVPDAVDVAQIAAMLRAVGDRTTRVLTTTPLDRPGVPGPRFDDEPATLAWICFHVLQEYARHVGHLDIAVELAAGTTGE